MTERGNFLTFDRRVQEFQNNLPKVKVENARNTSPKRGPGRHSFRPVVAYSFRTAQA